MYIHLVAFAFKERKEIRKIIDDLLNRGIVKHLVFRRIAQE